MKKNVKKARKLELGGGGGEAGLGTKIDGVVTPGLPSPDPDPRENIKYDQKP